jgi:tRNA(fMet)-specific endonuclease VapC
VLFLDTSAVSALLAGDQGVHDLLDQDERHALPVVVIGEYRFGLLRSKERKRIAPLLEQLIRDSVVLEISESTTRHYAQVREALRSAGRPIPENDVWIAALVRQHDLPLVSRDRDFDYVKGITRLDW